MIHFYLRSALKSIQRKKTFSVLNISGLTLGITVFLLTLEYFSYETGFNQFHQHLSGLYRIDIKGGKSMSPGSVPNLAPMMQKNIPGLRAVARFADNFNSGAIVSYQPASDAAKQVSFREERCVFVDKAFLDAFTFPMIEGDNELDNPNTVVITASVAKKIFGKEDPLGKVIQLHNQFGTLPCKVTGVIADLPTQSDIRFDYLFSSAVLKSPSYTLGADWAKLDNWDNDSYTTYAWLEDRADPAQVAALATKLWARSSPGYKKEDGAIELQPVSEIHLGSNLKDNNPTYGSRAMVDLILDLGILVLLIAWINYINFSTAYALSQAKEIGIHKIIGSDKRQIVFRYMAESLILNLAGLSLAFLLVGVVQALFNYLTGKTLTLSDLNHPTAWFAGAGILLAGILLSGGYVGWILSKFKPMVAIKFNDNGHTGNVLLRKGLVIFQFVISILFIASTIVVYNQVRFMKNHHLGMNIDNLVVIDGPQIRDSSSKTQSLIFKTELQKLPFIEKISNTGSVPGIGFAHNFEAAGVTRLHPDKGDERKNYFISLVDESYFDLFQISFLNGRNFSMDEVSKGFKAGKLILNETAAIALGLTPALSPHSFITWNDKQWEVLGIVRDYHHRSLKEKIEPIIFIPQYNIACYTIKIDPDHFRQKMDIIKSSYEKTFPGNPFDYKILKEAYDAQYADEQRAATIALSISVLIITIACLGLIGLSVFTAKRRTKEIGIRKILGARAASLFLLLLKDFVFLVGIAFVIASPLAWLFMNQWLQDFAYHVAVSWWVFALSGVTALFIAVVTVSFQAVKAALANPIRALRAE